MAAPRRIEKVSGYACDTIRRTKSKQQKQKRRMMASVSAVTVTALAGMSAVTVAFGFGLSLSPSLMFAGKQVARNRAFSVSARVVMPSSRGFGTVAGPGAGVIASRKRLAPATSTSWNKKLYSHNGSHNHNPNQTNETRTTEMVSVSPRQQIIDRFEAERASPGTNTKTKTNNNKKKKDTTTTTAATAMDARTKAERKALLETLDWLEHVVIGYNFCPFAEKPLLRSEIQVQVVLGTDETEILGAVLGESLRLGRDNRHATTNKSPRGTALVVCPDLSPNNFVSFLQVYNVLVEGVLPDHDLDEEIQIAPFHPLFCFGDGDDDDEDDDGEDGEDDDDGDELAMEDAIDHYTNRSPHPTFHVLREAEVAKAVEALDGKAEKVWKRNVDFLQAMEDLFARESSKPHDPTTELLRSVFLKGKAGQAVSSGSNDTAATISQTQTQTSGCPVTANIQHYNQEIQHLLKEFRKKVY